MTADDRMVWVDIETTGLNPLTEIILEVGFRITDAKNLDTLDEFDILVWEPGFYTKKVEAVLESTDPAVRYVADMHRKSGLWDAAEREGFTMADAEAQLVDWLASHGVHADVPMKERDPLCGSSLHFDRGFLAETFPQVEAAFHYRNIDISTIKELCRRFNRPVYDKLDEYSTKQEKHRVMPDLDDTIGEFRFYRDNFLWIEV
jgi:oligoribonuclease